MTSFNHTCDNDVSVTLVHIGNSMLIYRGKDPASGKYVSLNILDMQAAIKALGGTPIADLDKFLTKYKIL